MTTTLSMEIGQTERTLRSLLDRELQQAGLAFPEWTMLTLARTAGPLTAAALVARQAAGAVSSPEEASATLQALQAKGLLTADPAGGELALTDDGEALYAPLAQTVSSITGELWGDLPPADLDVTRRVLTEVTRRARARLGD